MMTKTIATFALAAFALTGIARAGESTLVFTDDSEFNFKAYKLIGSQEGSFLLYDGEVKLTDDKIESAKIEGNLEMDSVLTKNKTLTKRLKSSDFFDVEKHPEGSFKSTSITKKSGSTYDVKGTLTIKEIEKEVSFPAEITYKGGLFELEGSLKVKRQDWKLNYDGLGDNAIKDMVDLDIYIAAEADEK